MIFVKAMEYGPVPNRDFIVAVRNKKHYAEELIPLFLEAIGFPGKDASNTLIG